MASEAPSSEPSSFIENLINSRNRDLSFFLPFFLGLNASSPPQETENRGGPRDSPDRIILINPFTQGMVVIERSSGNSSFPGLESLFNDLFARKGGQPPASKASIDAMKCVELVGGEDDQCVICLEEWETGEKAKEMPCKHKFHGECIEKWLKIHGSCPVCRYEMPVDESEDEKKRNGESGEQRRREIWVSFAMSSDRRSGENDRNSPSENTDSFESDQGTQS